MKAEIRTEKIANWIKNHKPFSSKNMIYKTEHAEPMPVYEIPVEYLIFNQYNGRIGTFVKTYEKQHSPLDASTDKGEEEIIKFLWNSDVPRNKITQQDISKKGQLEFGIITKDGVVIDGNRRCMLLKKIAQEEKRTPTYFRTVVLDDTLETNPKEIRRLETIYQMGIDEKVTYKPIEQYLKCKDLSKDFSNEEIAKMMGKKPSDINNYLNILELMEEYLKKQGYTEMYTVLGEDKVEGPFVDLRGYLETQKTGKGIRGRDWEPDENIDIDDLKNVYFSYIRAGYRTAHGIRDIGNPSKGQGFFNHRKIWESFLSRYDEEIQPIIDGEKSLEDFRKERPDEDIENIIKARDNDWKNKVGRPKDKQSLMMGNLKRTKRDLDDQNESNSPMELLQRAIRTLSLVNVELDSFHSQEIRDISHEIRKMAEHFIKTIDKNR